MLRHAVVLVESEFGDALATDVQSTFVPETTRVAGYPLLKRNLMMLQSLGIQDITIVTRGSAETCRQQVAQDHDVHVHLRWVQDRQAEARKGLSLAVVRRWLHGRTLVMRADAVFEAALVRSLVEGGIPRAGVAVAVDRRPESETFGVPVQLQSRRITSVADAAGRRDATLLPLAVVDERALPAVAGRNASDAMSLQEALQGLATAGQLWAFEIGSRFWQPVRNSVDARAAENLLWNSCRKPIDGLVSRHINRNISLAISRRIAHLPISPNHVSTLTFSLGIAAAMCIVQGSWAWMALGVTLFQLNSILDGVDGELARIKFKASHLGEWLDTLSDDMSNMLVFGAVAYASYANTGHSMYLWLGGLTLVPGILTSAYQYHWLIRSHRGDLLAFRWVFERGKGNGPDERGPVAALVDNIKYFFKKDFFALLTFAMGLAGWLPWMLFLTAFGYTALLVTVISNEVVIARLERGEGRRYERVVASQSVRIRR